MKDTTKSIITTLVALISGFVAYKYGITIDQAKQTATVDNVTAIVTAVTGLSALVFDIYSHIKSK